MDDSRIPVQTGHEMKPPRKPRRGFGLKIIAAFVAGILFLSAVTGVGPLGDWIQNWRGNLYAEQTTGQYDGTPAQRVIFARPMKRSAPVLMKRSRRARAWLLASPATPPHCIGISILLPLRRVTTVPINDR